MVKRTLDAGLSHEGIRGLIANGSPGMIGCR